jgi:hypothetical protein
VDVALDLITNDLYEAWILKEYLDVHQVKKYRGKQSINRVKETSYSSATPSVNTNLVKYATRPSKVNGKPCCHIEWRTISAAANRAAKFASLADLAELDYYLFWKRRIVLRSASPDPEKVGRIARGQPKRKGSYIVDYGHGIRINKDVRNGAVLLRASCSQFDFVTAQEALDALGKKYEICFPKISADWILPNLVRKRQVSRCEVRLGRKMK